MKKTILIFGSAIMLLGNSGCSDDPCLAVIGASLPDLITKSIDVASQATNPDGSFGVGAIVDVGMEIFNVADAYNTCRGTLEAANSNYEVKLYRKAPASNEFTEIGTATYSASSLSPDAGLDYSQQVQFTGDGDYYLVGVSNSTRIVEERNINNNSSNSAENEAKTSKIITVRGRRGERYSSNAGVRFLPAPNLVSTTVKSENNEFITTYY
jgi:hypothetical protein